MPLAIVLDAATAAEWHKPSARPNCRDIVRLQVPDQAVIEPSEAEIVRAGILGTGLRVTDDFGDERRERNRHSPVGLLPRSIHQDDYNRLAYSAICSDNKAKLGVRNPLDCAG